MGGLLARLFGSKKVIDSTISGIDKVFFTREEKADYLLKFLAAYEPFKLAQRILAIMFSSVFLLGMLAAIIVFVVGIIMGDMKMASSGKDIAQMTWDSLGTPESLIVGFYFAGGTINSLMKKYDTKKSEVINNRKND